MEHIILIQPNIGYSFETLGNKPFIPLSLLNLSRLIIKEFKVRIIDQRISRNWKKEIYSELKKNPLMAGITSATGCQISYALEISRFIKKHSDVPIVWGGCHGTSLPKQTLENHFIDYVIKGQGEGTILELARHLKRKKSKGYKNKKVSEIAGLAYKYKGKIFENKNRKFIKLDKLPPTPYELVNVKKDYDIKIKSMSSILLATSCGCINRCTFCYNSINPFWDGLSVENIIKNMKKIITDYNIRYFFFADSDTFFNKERLCQICKAIIKNKLNIKWSACISPKLIFSLGDSDLKMLDAAGLDLLIIGVESASPHILKLWTNKNSDCRVINRRLKGYNIRPKYCFMIGDPNETIKDLKETVKLIYDLVFGNKNARCSLNLLIPYPRIPICAMFKSRSFSFPDTLEGWIDFSYADLMSVKQFMNKYYTFLSKKRIDTLFKILFLAQFFTLDDSFVGKIRLLKKIYEVVARLRMKYFYFDFMFLDILSYRVLRKLFCSQSLP